ncbi:hypothetical protein EVAR_79354_1 [Eumeta japonica]|uniref:Uncharacterized protein n=1 Tax=Eumeta variegata TaxID=151549 RepID=A0A4C1TEQ4_EUMVA|nr:hypothetical protein EVAR_79354_1 [Eumeta japonica]
MSIDGMATKTDGTRVNTDFDSPRLQLKLRHCSTEKWKTAMRTEVADAHFCASAYTGLRTGPAGTGLRQVGTCSPVKILAATCPVINTAH